MLFSELWKIIVNKVTFVGFRGRSPQSPTPGSVPVSNWTFPHHDRALTKFHPGSEQQLPCVVINNSHHPAVKDNKPAYHAFGKYWMQARGLLNYRLNVCWLKVIWSYLQSISNELERKIEHTVGEPNWIPAKLDPSRHSGSPLEVPLLLHLLCSKITYAWKAGIYFMKLRRLTRNQVRSRSLPIPMFIQIK